MTADERLIDLDAANERLAAMNLKADGATRTVGAEVTYTVTSEDGSDTPFGPSPADLTLTHGRKRRKDAGKPRPPKPPADAASTKQEGGAGITDDQVQRIMELIAQKDNTRATWLDVHVKLSFAYNAMAAAESALKQYVNSLRAKDAR